MQINHIRKFQEPSAVQRLDQLASERLLNADAAGDQPKVRCCWAFIIEAKRALAAAPPNCVEEIAAAMVSDLERGGCGGSL